MRISKDQILKLLERFPGAVPLKEEKRQFEDRIYFYWGDNMLLVYNDLHVAYIRDIFETSHDIASAMEARLKDEYWKMDG